MIAMGAVLFLAGKYLQRRDCVRFAVLMAFVFVGTLGFFIGDVLFGVPCKSALLKYILNCFVELSRNTTPTSLLSLVVVVIVIATTWNSLLLVCCDRRQRRGPIVQRHRPIPPPPPPSNNPPPQNPPQPPNDPNDPPNDPDQNDKPKSPGHEERKGRLFERTSDSDLALRMENTLSQVQQVADHHSKPVTPIRSTLDAVKVLAKIHSDSPNVSDSIKFRAHLVSPAHASTQRFLGGKRAGTESSVYGETISMFNLTLSRDCSNTQPGKEGVQKGKF